MKALTLHEPWATLIVLGRKKIETRGWATSHLGPLAIHAGKIVDLEACEEFEIEPASLHPGCVIGKVELLRCEKMTWETINLVSEAERRYGYFCPGRVSWHLCDPREFAMPTAARGYQFLWDWDGCGLR